MWIQKNNKVCRPCSSYWALKPVVPTDGKSPLTVVPAREIPPGWPELFASLLLPVPVASLRNGSPRRILSQTTFLPKLTGLLKAKPTICFPSLLHSKGRATAACSISQAKELPSQHRQTIPCCGALGTPDAPSNLLTCPKFSLLPKPSVATWGPTSLLLKWGLVPGPGIEGLDDSNTCNLHSWQGPAWGR